MAEGEGMSEDAERGDLGEWCSKHREWTHPDAPCWGCQKEAEAIARAERLEARIRELVAALPTRAWFDWAVQSYKKAPDSLTMMMPCTMGDIRKIAATLKGGAE